MKWSPPKRKLSILYDDLCPVCVSACEWMDRRAKYVECEFLKQSDPEVQKRYGPLLIEDGVQQFVVIADDEKIYLGNAARMVCFSALRGYRLFAYLIGNPICFPISEFFSETFARNRYRISHWFKRNPEHSCTTDRCAPKQNRQP